MTRGKQFGFLFGLLGLLVLCGWMVGLSAFIRNASAPVPADSLKKLDAIVVLTGGSNRLDAGFDLLEKGFGKKLFISGVYRGLEIKQLLKRWKDEPQGNLDCCVVLGFEADNTVGNASETVEWLAKEGFRSIYLVTSNYHMQRALLEFKRTAPGLDIIPYPVMPENTDMNNWWQDPKTRNLLLREYTKYVAASILLPFRSP